MIQTALQWLLLPFALALAVEGGLYLIDFYRRFRESWERVSRETSISAVQQSYPQD